MNTTLVLTHDCNLACTYCYAGEKFRASMDERTVRAGLDLAFRRARGDVDLGFFGGEPLLEWDLLERACVTATERAVREGRSLRLQVTTNGTLLTPERARRLCALNVEVALSIDGTRAAHDATRPKRGGQSSYDATVKAARMLRETGHSLIVIAVVAPANVRELGASVRTLVALGADRILLNPCFEAVWTDDDLAAWELGLREAADVYADRMRAGHPVAMPTFDNKLLAAVKGGLASCDSCGAGERELAIAPSGNLYPCARQVGEDRDHRWVVGHVSTGVDRARVAAIPRGPAHRECDECPERWRCGAGCMCANLAETGEADVPGGVQCWHEQITASVADAVGHALLAEQCSAFLEWTYARVARAPTFVENEELDDALTTSARRHLPVLRASA